MAKQLSVKQQIQQSIVNSQVQQALAKKQEQDRAALMANYAAFQEQRRDPDALNADFAAFMQSQQATPVQQATVNDVKAQTIPSLKETPKIDLSDWFEPKTASGRYINRESATRRNREYYQKQQQLEQIAAEQKYTDRGNDRWNASVNDTLAMLNSKDFKALAEEGNYNKLVEEQKNRQKYQDEMREKQIASFDKYNTENLPVLTDEQKALEEQILNADRYATYAPSEDKWNDKFLSANQKESAIRSTTPEKVAYWLSPETKLTNREKGEAKVYASSELAKVKYGPNHQPLFTNEEERRHYADMVNLINKTNAVTNFAAGTLKPAYNLADIVSDAGRSVGNQIGGLGAAVTDKFGLTEGATQKHNEEVEAANKFFEQNEASMRQSFANAQTQNPLAYAGGQLAGQIAMYSITNPVFDSIAEGVGITNALAKFFINQGAQNVQDLVLDTAPLVKELMADGSLSEDDKREALGNILWNSIGNMGIGGFQAIPQLSNYLAAKDAVNAAYRENALEGLRKLQNINPDDFRFRQMDDYADSFREVPDLSNEGELNDFSKHILEGRMKLDRIISGEPEIELKKLKPIDRKETIIQAIDRLRRVNLVDEAAKDIGNRRFGNFREVNISEFIDDDGKITEAIAKHPEIQTSSTAAHKSVDQLNRETASLLEEVKEYRKKGKVKDGKIHLGEVPDILKEYGVGDKPLVMKQDEIKKVLAFPGDRVTDAHYIGTGAFEAIPEKLDNPVAIIKNKSKQGVDSIMVLTDIANLEGDPALIALKVHKNGEVVTDDLVRSMYGKANIKDYLKRQIGEGNVLYFDATKSAYDKALSDRHSITGLSNAPNVGSVDQAVPSNLNVTDGIENVNKQSVKNTGEVNKVMAEDIGIDQPKTPESVRGTFEIPDTPENAPTGPKPGPSSTEDLWNELKNGEQPTATAASPAPPSPPVPPEGPKGPELNEKGQKLSSLHSTLQNTDKLTDAEKQVFADKNGFWYDPDNEKQLAENVKAEIEANGLDSIYDKYAYADLDYSKLSGIDSHRLHTAAFDYSRLGTEALQNGDKDLASFYNAKARALELKAREIGTAGGQFNAATAYYAHTPEGAVNKAYEILDDQIKDFKTKNPKLTGSIDELSDLIAKKLKDVDVDSIMTGTDDAAKADLRRQVIDGLEEYLKKSNNKDLKNTLDGLSNKEIDQLIADKYAKDIAKTLDMYSMGSFGVKQETIDQVLDIFEEAQQYGINSKQYYKLEKQAYALLANDLMDGKSFKDKFNAWRYFAMLSNPLTHIRNNLGNLANGGLVGIKNNLAAAIEEGAERVAKAQGKSGLQGGRTKSVLNLTTDKDLIEASAKDFDDEAYRLYKQGGNKYINVGDDIEAAAHVWKNEGIGKGLNTATEGNSMLLDAEDIIAGKAKYQTSLAGFLKANGADASIFTKTDDASKQLLDQGRTYALKQANEATFHQNGAFAKYFTEHFNGKIGNIVIPFKKTPANILQACLEYSPAMFLKVAKETNAWKKGAITTAEYIDDISKGVVGSVGLGIGALLAHEGILSVSSGNENEDAFNKKRGQQTLALKIGDKYFNIGDLAPASMPLVVGASIYDTAKNAKSGGDAALDSILNGLGTISNTVTDMTMLSGLADFVSAARYAESNADVGLSLAENVAGNLASQMLPTVGGKIEKTIDDTKRTTYTDKTDKFAKFVDQERRYLQTKIPGLQEAGEKLEQSEIPVLQKIGDKLTLEPQIDGWGNEMKVEDYGIGAAGRTITNFLNPLTTTTDTSDRLDNELRQIYKDNKNDENVLKFGQNSSSEAKVGNDKMTDKQWTEYQKSNGQMKHDLGMSFIDSEAYKGMSAADKASALNSMGDFAKAYNQNKIAGKEMSSTNQKLAEIYDKAGGGQKGAAAVASEITAKAYSKESGLDSDSNAAKAIQKDIKNGDMKAAQEKMDAATYLSEAGFTKPGPTYTYYNAQEVIPSLTPEEFTKTYKAIDSDGNQGIKQDEVIDYLNKNHITSESEAKKIWKAYGSSEWKSIPSLNDGKWTKKKK